MAKEYEQAGREIIERWYSRFLERLKEEGIDINNPASLGLVAVMEVPDNAENDTSFEIKAADKFNSLEECEEHVKKFRDLVSFAFMARDTDGTYAEKRNEASDFETSALWLSDNLKADPKKVSYEHKAWLFEQSRNQRLFIRNLTMGEDIIDGGRFILTDDHHRITVSKEIRHLQTENERTEENLKISSSKEYGKENSYKERLKMLKPPAGFTQEEWATLVYRRELSSAFESQLKTLHSDASWFFTGGHKVDHMTGDERYSTQALQTSILRQKTEKNLCLLLHLHPEWRNDVTKVDQLERSLMLANVAPVTLSSSQRSALRECPLGDDNYITIEQTLLKLYAPKSFRQIMETENIRDRSGKPIPAQNTFDFARNLARHALEDGLLLSRVNAEGEKEDVLYALDGNKLAPTASVHYYDELHRLKQDIEKQLSPDLRKSDEAQQLLQSLKNCDDNLFAACRGTVRTPIPFGILSGKASGFQKLSTAIENYMKAQPKDKIPDPRQQNVLKDLHRLLNLTEYGKKEKAFPEQDVQTRIAEKLVHAFASDYLKLNSRYWSDKNRDRFEAGRKMLTDHGVFQKNVQEMLKNDLFLSLTTGKTPAQLDKLLKTNSEKLLNAAVYDYRKNLNTVKGKAVERYGEIARELMNLSSNLLDYGCVQPGKKTARDPSDEFCQFLAEALIWRETLRTGKVYSQDTINTLADGETLKKFTESLTQEELQQFQKDPIKALDRQLNRLEKENRNVKSWALQRSERLAGRIEHQKGSLFFPKDQLNGEYPKKEIITDHGTVPGNRLGLSIERGAINAVIFGYLAQKGYAIDDILNPLLMQPERELAAQNVLIAYQKMSDPELAKFTSDCLMEGLKAGNQYIKEKVNDPGQINLTSFWRPQTTNIPAVLHYIQNCGQELQHPDIKAVTEPNAMKTELNLQTAVSRDLKPLTDLNAHLLEIRKNPMGDDEITRCTALMKNVFGALYTAQKLNDIRNTSPNRDLVEGLKQQPADTHGNLILGEEYSAVEKGLEAHGKVLYQAFWNDKKNYFDKPLFDRVVEKMMTDGLPKDVSVTLQPDHTVHVNGLTEFINRVKNEPLTKEKKAESPKKVLSAPDVSLKSPVKRRP